VNEEDARACADIPEAACRETPRSFVLILLANFLTKLGDAIASPKTVLSWVMVSVQAPTPLIGFLVPIRESGSLIPQLFIASWVRRLAVRKWVWIVGALLQAAAVLAMGLVVFRLEGAPAGWALLGLLVLFSLARGLSSVASKDVLGKTVPRRRRGQLTGWSASAAGLVTLGVGAMLMVPALSRQGSGLFGALLLAAGGLWLAAAVVYAQIQEFPGETAGARNAFVEALGRLSLLKDDAPFRRFVLTRSLMLCSALSAPFYVLLGREAVGNEPWLLGLFVISGGLAGLVAAPVWGRYADRSSRRVMMVAGGFSAAIGLLVVLASALLPDLAASLWFMPLAYLLLSVAHGGVRVGRKTYVVDLAQGNKRTDYVSVSNSVIGVVLLVTGVIGALASVLGPAGVIAVLSMMGLAGVMLASGLPETG
jgi:MFS family permease